jgi:hypothetical protein
METSSPSHQPIKRSPSHWLIKKTQDQSASCFSITGALLESSVRSALISILSSAESSSREAEQSIDVRTGSARSCIQRFATTHTSLGPASRLDARNDTPKINKHRRTKQRITTTSLFYGRHKFRNRSTTLPPQTSKSCKYSASFSQGLFKYGARLHLNKLHFHNHELEKYKQSVIKPQTLQTNSKQNSLPFSVSLELC